MGKSIQVINEISELGSPINKKAIELRFDCPYCYDIRGKADDDAKLYFNTKKGTGFCFKCHTVVLLQKKVDQSLPSLINSLQEKLKHFISGDNKKDKLFEQVDKLKLYDISHLPPITPEDEEYKYLISRKGFKKEFIRQYNLRKVLSKKKGIVIPSERGNTITYYQIRYLPEYSKPIKYKSPTSTKPLFFILEEYKKPNLVICEGVFDAMALSTPNIGAVACLGTYLSPYQCFQLQTIYKPYQLDSIWLCLDSDAVDKLERLQYQIEQLKIAKNVFWGIPPKGMDPAEAEGKVKLLHPLQGLLYKDFLKLESINGCQQA